MAGKSNYSDSQIMWSVVVCVCCWLLSFLPSNKGKEKSKRARGQGKGKGKGRVREG